MRLARWGAQVGVAVLGVVAATTCQFSDVLTTPGVENVVLSYSGDTILVVGSAAIPSARAEVDGAALPRAQFQYASSDTSIVAVRTGDSLLAKRRGTVTLTVTLASAVLPSDPPEITQTVRAVIDTLVLDSTSVTFSSLGDTVRLVATALDAEGNTVGGATAAWESADTAVVSVTPSGRLQARRNGTAAVRAVVDLDTAVVAVTVQQELIRYPFEPQSLRLDALGAQASATATGRDARGFPIGGVPPAWSIGDDAIALVGAVSGVVTAIAEGETYLYATRSDVTDSVSLVVDQRATRVVITPDPVPPITSLEDEVQLTARAFDRINQELQTAAPIWFTLDPGRVRVSSDGVVTALGIGVARVVARLDDGADTANVSISNTPASVEISPDTAQATSISDTITFSASVRNGRGDLISGAPVAWRTPDSAVVRVQGDGLAIAMSVGVARVIATSGTKADTAIVRVTNSPAIIDIVPGGRFLSSIGDVDTPQVVIQNARGANLGRGSVTWTTDDANIVRVSPIGQVQARDTGQTYVRATSGLFTDSVLYTVNNTPSGIAIFGAFRDTLAMTALGQSFTFQVVVVNGRNIVITNYPVAWRSSNASVVDTVTGTGTVTAVGFGSALLVARAENVEDSVVVIVENPTRLYVNNGIVVSQRFGTIQRPYAKIQDAADAADANDTIVISRGSGPYAETVRLVRRLTLLGDSAPFTGNRNPANLPLIAHDTGGAGITAYTTAPMTIKYLALRHTLDGPAIDADGSDLVIDYFFVNRTSGVTSRIGRGISIANSPSGTRITNTMVDSVRGYGIKLTTVSSATVQGNTIRGVDSLGFGVEEGAGIEVSGGATNMVSDNTIRATQGPQILVQGSNGIAINSNDLAGRHQLVRVVGVTGNGVFGTTFDLNQRIQDGDDHRGSQSDDRSGLAIESSSSFAVFNNTFTETPSANAMMDAAHVTDSREVSFWRNAFRGGFINIVSERSTINVTESRSDTARVFLRATDADTIRLDADTVRNPPGSLNDRGVGLGCVDVSGAASQMVVLRSRFENCHLGAGPAISMNSPGGMLEISSSTFLGAHQTAFEFSGQRALIRGNTASGLGTDPLPRNNVVGMSAVADTVEMVGNAVAGYRRGTGILAAGSVRTRLDSTFVTLNGVGIRLGVSADLGVDRTDIFDNDTAGVMTMGSTPVGVLGLWWGDARGPRRDAEPTAAGDSAGPNLIVDPVRSTPVFPGTTPASIRIVRGNNQTASAGTTLAKRLTVRVIDSSGRPVSGVSVTFTVRTAGGTLDRPADISNASGLAEATLTVGSGTNTVDVTGTSVSIGTVTFTATGTL